MHNLAQASTANLVNQVCFEENQGTAASCEADSDLWLTQYVFCLNGVNIILTTDLKGPENWIMRNFLALSCYKHVCYYEYA